MELLTAKYKDEAEVLKLYEVLKLDESKILQVLDWCYNKSINGLPGLDSAEELASNYLDKTKDPEKAINSLIRWQKAKCTTSGFLCGLPGVFALPATLPANLTSVVYVHLRMITAIAYIRGYDIRDDRVKTFAYICLCGNAGKDVLKAAGIKIGTKLTKNAIGKISGTALTKINRAVGFRLITKFGEKGVVNLGKAVPVAGAIVGGTVDFIGTTVVSKAAKSIFVIETEE